MSRGKQLQEMEVKTPQSKTAVNAGAQPAEAIYGAGVFYAQQIQTAGGPS